MHPISFSGSPEDDAPALSAFVEQYELPLHTLPPKHLRSDVECRLADEVHRGCRSVRRSFMCLHAEWLYERITETYTRHRDLPELACAASIIVPGLVPTLQQMAEEDSKRQAEKEGREIDQGIFFWGVLRHPTSGAHLLRGMRRSTEAATRLLPILLRQGRLHLNTVEIEKRGVAIYVTLKNLGCLNAEDNQIVADLEIAVDLALLDENTQVGVLRGGVMTHPRYAGKRVFSAGINLKDLYEGRLSFVRFLLLRELGFLNKIMHGLIKEGTNGAGSAISDRKPWIAAVDAFAIGGGAQLLLVCDYIIADSDAFIALPAAQEGIIPGAANLRLTRFVGDRIARQMILSGRRIMANAVEARGIIDEVVDASEMDTAIATAVARLGVEAVRVNSAILNMAEEPQDAFRSYMAEFASLQAQRIYGRDVIEKLRVRADRLQQS